MLSKTKSYKIYIRIIIIIEQSVKTRKSRWRGSWKGKYFYSWQIICSSYTSITIISRRKRAHQQQQQSSSYLYKFKICKQKKWIRCTIKHKKWTLEKKNKRYEHTKVDKTSDYWKGFLKVSTVSSEKLYLPQILHELIVRRFCVLCHLFYMCHPLLLLPIVCLYFSFSVTISLCLSRKICVHIFVFRASVAFY